jgi:hypothetical protein
MSLFNDAVDSSDYITSNDRISEQDILGRTNRLLSFDATQTAQKSGGGGGHSKALS